MFGARDTTQGVSGRSDLPETDAALPRALIERLALYHQIVTRIGEQGHDTLSSAELASLLDIDPTLVRKDMAMVGVTGRPKIGYPVADVLNRLDDVLGLSSRKNAILIGSGRLGGAIAAYRGFSQYGLKISAVFDSDYAKVGQTINGHVILPMEKCRNIVEIFGIEIAILTVPVEAAQPLADWLVKHGIRAIWNFSPTQLRVPPEVVVRNENLAQGLAQLIHHLKQVKAQGVTAPPRSTDKPQPSVAPSRAPDKSQASAAAPAPDDSSARAADPPRSAGQGAATPPRLTAKPSRVSREGRL